MLRCCIILALVAGSALADGPTVPPLVILEVPKLVVRSLRDGAIPPRRSASPTVPRLAATSRTRPQIIMWGRPNCKARKDFRLSVAPIFRASGFDVEPNGIDEFGSVPRYEITVGNQRVIYHTMNPRRARELIAIVNKGGKLPVQKAPFVKPADVPAPAPAQRRFRFRPRGYNIKF